VTTVGKSRLSLYAYVVEVRHDEMSPTSMFCLFRCFGRPCRQSPATRDQRASDKSLCCRRRW